jgi:hypothetical protein
LLSAQPDVKIALESEIPVLQELGASQLEKIHSIIPNSLKGDFSKKTLNADNEHSKKISKVVLKTLSKEKKTIKCRNDAWELCKRIMKAKSYFDYAIPTLFVDTMSVNPDRAVSNPKQVVIFGARPDLMIELRPWESLNLVKKGKTQEARYKQGMYSSPHTDSGIIVTESYKLSPQDLSHVDFKDLSFFGRNTRGLVMEYLERNQCIPYRIKPMFPKRNEALDCSWFGNTYHVPIYAPILCSIDDNNYVFELDTIVKANIREGCEEFTINPRVIMWACAYIHSYSNLDDISPEIITEMVKSISSFGAGRLNTFFARTPEEEGLSVEDLKDIRSSQNSNPFRDLFSQLVRPERELSISERFQNLNDEIVDLGDTIFSDRNDLKEDHTLEDRFDREHANSNYEITIYENSSWVGDRLYAGVESSAGDLFSADDDRG